MNPIYFKTFRNLGSSLRCDNIGFPFIGLSSYDGYRFPHEFSGYSGYWKISKPSEISQRRDITFSSIGPTFPFYQKSFIFFNEENFRGSFFFFSISLFPFSSSFIYLVVLYYRVLFFKNSPQRTIEQSKHVGG